MWVFQCRSHSLLVCQLFVNCNQQSGHSDHIVKQGCHRYKTAKPQAMSKAECIIQDSTSKCCKPYKVCGFNIVWFKGWKHFAEINFCSRYHLANAVVTGFSTIQMRQFTSTIILRQKYIMFYVFLIAAITVYNFQQTTNNANLIRVQIFPSTGLMKKTCPVLSQLTGLSVTSLITHLHAQRHERLAWFSHRPATGSDNANNTPEFRG